MASKQHADSGRRLPPNAGKGRPKGSPNKLTADVKAMILGALDKAGGETYLLEQAKANPNAFLTLIGKVLPKEVTGADGSPLLPSAIRIELVRPGE